MPVKFPVELLLAALAKSFCQYCQYCNLVVPVLAALAKIFASTGTTGKTVLPVLPVLFASAFLLAKKACLLSIVPSNLPWSLRTSTAPVIKSSTFSYNFNTCTPIRPLARSKTFPPSMFPMVVFHLAKVLRFVHLLQHL